ncbi:CRISPR-associated ring nuclease Crn1 [Sulfurisphaera ohwakuensis]|uniref:CRISPR-associated protein n=1 Tax=Sulfurisphaera ohwakuensis TaxID=69656 RepID=A0A650CGG6_SULOH|nr:CRISPR-associated ring nuclease Crn1 [Sulfurisphaera ohwakuensis]MBB5252669.1 CRISPR-associated protein Csx14 [Sulfurisphaera ohwakuensis]QGR16902.1 CRISPR-associated protein [Sulfurisphaera ohwakuensis]
MVKLIATLGTSPGGIFETYTNLINGTYESENPSKIEIQDIYIIRTKDKEVELAWKLVKALFICMKVPAQIADIPVSINDITSKEDYEIFKKEIFQRISKGDFIDFTGGRKAMSVAAAIGAVKKEAYLVTTIIPQQEYNRIQQQIKELKDREKEINDAISTGSCENIGEELKKLIIHGAKTILLT